ncbi:deoxyribonuclease-2-alpha-like [Brevipalpus obovatus]|uniref:deoxyribonuclease-2-alpha-like n=1 Tax=Brevipalpus obovatus TaxID=246614 RepID=UPI003D9F5120
MISALSILVLILSISASYETYLTCRDDNGNPVDWWIIYNFPTKVLSKGEGESGLRYTYITSNDEDKSKFKLSPKDMNEEDNIFFNTVSPIYSDPKKYEYIFYNDQYGDKKFNRSDETYLKTAHAKGVLGIGEETGFWLIHSIPHFMPTPEEFSQGLRHPSSGRVKGQTAICLTFDKSEIPKVTRQLLVEKVNVYGSRIVMEQNLMKLLDEDYQEEKKISRSTMKTKNGVHLEHFAKTPSFPTREKIDLFSRMAQDLGTNLNVQTWKSGPGGNQASDCSKNSDVKNIVFMAMKMKNGAETSEWKYTKDHSKWAVSDSAEDNPQTCIGDLNRMNSQLIRGGGMMCMPDPDVQKAFKDMIHEMEPCQRN